MTSLVEGVKCEWYKILSRFVRDAHKYCLYNNCVSAYIRTDKIAIFVIQTFSDVISTLQTPNVWLMQLNIIILIVLVGN